MDNLDILHLFSYQHNLFFNYLLFPRIPTESNKVNKKKALQSLATDGREVIKTVRSLMESVRKFCMRETHSVTSTEKLIGQQTPETHLVEEDY